MRSLRGPLKLSQKGQEKLRSSGLPKEELIEFFRDVVEGVKLMNRRQRWEFRRDLKSFCRIANVQWPYGKGEDNVPETGKEEKQVVESEETGC